MTAKILLILVLLAILGWYCYPVLFDSYDQWGLNFVVKK